MPFSERKTILENLSCVDQVIDFKDDEIGSCIDALEKIKKLFPEDEILFCNGGDRNKKNIPEMTVEGVEFVFGVGGSDKKNSSSWILKEFSFYKEERIWGTFFNLFQDEKMKLKELIVAPGKGMSFQRHFHRNEIWFISKGSCEVNFSKADPKNYENIKLSYHEVFHVPKLAWHQIINTSNEPCHIIEIQYGDKTNEDDIERLRYYKGNNSLD